MRRPTPGLLAVVLGLSACALSSGPPYRVQTSSPSGITILTDPALRNIGLVRQVAQTHCAQYGKTAVQVPAGSKLRGGQAVVTFTCRAS